MNQDKIANLISTLKNAYQAQHSSITISYSKLLENIVKILFDSGYIAKYNVVEEQKNIKTINITLKYVNGVPAIVDIVEVSRPSLRIYKNYDEIPFVLNGYGVAIISTSKGVITDKNARQLKVGGEVLLQVW